MDKFFYSISFFHLLYEQALFHSIHPFSFILSNLFFHCPTHFFPFCPHFFGNFIVYFLFTSPSFLPFQVSLFFFFLSVSLFLFQPTALPYLSFSAANQISNVGDFF